MTHTARALGRAAIAACAPLTAWAQDISPLESVMAGREAAKTTRLTEAGIREMTISSANIVLVVAALAGLALVALGLYRMWSVQYAPMRGQATMGSGVWMVVLGGLMTITAVVAGLAPSAILG